MASIRACVVLCGGWSTISRCRFDAWSALPAKNQVDFGSGARNQQADGKRRCTHVFRIVLSHSRKGYSEAVYRQTTEEFRCLENAFQHFGGVPQTLVPDNLKAGVLTPD